MAIKPAKASTNLNPEAQASPAPAEDRPRATKPADAGDLEWEEEKAAPPPAVTSGGSSAPAAEATTGTQIAAHTPVEDDGFGALDDVIGFGSFPIVTLGNDGKFVLGKNGPLADEFSCVIQQARKKYLYKIDDEHLVYSYDELTNDSGRPLTSVYDEWRADGVDFQNKDVQKQTYIEAVAQIVSAVGKDAKGNPADLSDVNGKLMICSVAPRSAARLGGYRAELRIKGKSLREVTTRVYPGAKIQLGGKRNWFPWEFEEVRAA